MKKAYIKPTILCHEFRVEKGFATSVNSSTFSNTQADDNYTIFKSGFDKGNKGYFTRTGDSEGVWSDDGTNGGVWD